MSIKKSHNVVDILKRVKTAYLLKTDAALATFLNIKPNIISMWKIRQSLDWDLIFTKCDDINPGWLLTGEGSMRYGRIFIYEGRILDDIDSGLTPAEIKSRYSADYPELVDAEIEGPTIKQSTEIYEFKARNPLLMVAESTPIYNDKELAEIIDILQRDLPEAKGAILKILKYRKGLKEGIKDFMEFDKPVNEEG